MVLLWVIGRKKGRSEEEREIRWAPLAVTQALTLLPAWISGGSTPCGPRSSAHALTPPPPSWISGNTF